MGNDDNTRVDDHYLTEVLKLTPGFISHHARSMGNRTRPRSYFLDTVIAYLRKLEAESQGKQRNNKLETARMFSYLNREVEEIRARQAMKKRKVG